MTTSRFHISRALMRVRRVLRNDQLVLSILALIVGSAVGGAIILFREGINLFQVLFFQSESDALTLTAASLPWWHLIGAQRGRIACGALYLSFYAGTPPPWAG